MQLVIVKEVLISREETFGCKVTSNNKEAAHVGSTGDKYQTQPEGDEGMKRKMENKGKHTVDSNGDI